MRLCASGMASSGLRSIKERREMYHAKHAISALHDGLLAVCSGKISVDEARDFFCFDNHSKFIGGVITFSEK